MENRLTTLKAKSQALRNEIIRYRQQLDSAKHELKVLENEIEQIEIDHWNRGYGVTIETGQEVVIDYGLRHALLSDLHGIKVPDFEIGARVIVYRIDTVRDMVQFEKGVFVSRYVQADIVRTTIRQGARL